MDDFKKTGKEVEKETKTTIETGLTTQEAEKRSQEQGKNKFDEAPKESLVKKFLRSLSDFTTIILLVAAVISFYTAFATEHGDLFEGLLIIAIVLINSVLAIVQEGNAEKALESLQDEQANSDSDPRWKSRKSRCGKSSRGRCPCFRIRVSDYCRCPISGNFTIKSRRISANWGK